VLRLRFHWTEEINLNGVYMKSFMKIAIIGLGVLSASVATAQSAPKIYQEDINYTVVSETATPTPEVREYFSFYCGHCYSFEKFIKMIKPKLNEGVFERNHVSFLGGIPKSAQDNLTDAVALALTIESTTQQEAVIDAIFNRIHKERKRKDVYSRMGVREVFKEQGVDHKWFDANIDSSAVQMHAKQMRDTQAKMTTSGALEGVPTVIVNGKYRIENSGLNKKDPVGDYISLVNYLLTNP
tara:strand:- start:201 stop:920 length:720 start_codon:yes stop_codon:yes gene_type:complete